LRTNEQIIRILLVHVKKFNLIYNATSSSNFQISIQNAILHKN